MNKYVNKKDKQKLTYSDKFPQKNKGDNEQMKIVNKDVEAYIQQLLIEKQQLETRNQQLIFSAQELSKEKIFLEKIVETSRAIIVGLDRNHTIRIFNQGAELITGYKKEEVLGKDWFKIFFPKNIIDEMNRVWKDAWGVISHSYINPILTKTGEEKIISWISTGIYDNVDESQHLLLTIGEDITERKKAEEKLHESEEKYRTLVNNTQQGVVVAQVDPIRLSFVNHAISKITGYEEEELLAMNQKQLYSLVHSQYRRSFFDNFVKRIRGEDIPNQNEYRLVRKDGSIIWVSTYSSRIKYCGQNATMTTFFDITQQKQAEAELIKLSTAVKQSPSVIAITDLDGNLQYVNPKFTEITGYSLEEVFGQNPRILNSGEHSAEFYKELWTTIAFGKAWHGEFHNKKKNGELYWENASISPILDKQGKVINYIKVAEDITERKRNELIQKVLLNIANAVTHSANIQEFIFFVRVELGKLIDTSNFYIVLYDKNTNTFSLPFHIDEKDKVKQLPGGKLLTYYVAKTKKPLLATQSVLDKLVKSGEVELVGANSKVWLGVPLFSKGEILGVMAVQSYDDENAYDEKDIRTMEIIAHQISLSLERKKAEEDLIIALRKAKESDRLKRAFLANMSHEIRTPMNSILGFTELLKEPKLSGEEKADYINIIQKSGKRLLDTINDIIDISKIESGQVEVTKAKISVNDLLKEIYNLFSIEAKSKGIELICNTELSDKDAYIVTDRYKLGGILINLIKNAIKFTNQGKIIYGYSIKKGNDYKILEFYVKDTGIGIQRDKLSVVFNRFEQADIKSKRIYEGSGLGLAIAKSYVEILGGKIDVNSEKDAGTTFTFTIPYLTEGAEKQNGIHSNVKNTQKVSLSKLSIIVAEDDDASRMFFKAIFSHKFRKLIFAKNGRETVEKCRENPETDVILMDMRMPDMDGYQATREIRKFNKDVIIIAQTAFALQGDRDKVIKAGCDDYITKPIIKELLFEKIINNMKKKGIHQYLKMI